MNFVVIGGGALVIILRKSSKSILHLVCLVEPLDDGLQFEIGIDWNDDQKDYMHPLIYLVHNYN